MILTTSSVHRFLVSSGTETPAVGLGCVILERLSEEKGRCEGMFINIENDVNFHVRKKVLLFYNKLDGLPGFARIPKKKLIKNFKNM